MNCKQGDLAIIVRSDAGNEGKIVQCMVLLGDAPVHYQGLRYGWSAKGPVWLIKAEGSPIRNGLGITMNEAPILDQYLRPIRPMDESDGIQDGRNIPIKDIA